MIDKFRILAMTILVLVFLTIPVSSLKAESLYSGEINQNLSVSSTMDWQAGQITITALLHFETPGLLKNRTVGENILQESLPLILTSAIAPLQVTSSENVAGIFESHPELYNSVSRIILSLNREYCKITLDQRSMECRWILPVNSGLIPVLLTYREQIPVPEDIRWSSSESFTGIVIYAAEPLNTHGTDRIQSLIPVLLPQIYNESMQLVFDPGMVQKSLLMTEGPVYYSEEIENRDITGRVGHYPLMITARKLFGEIPGDIILSDQDVRRILGTPHNRELIEAGKIIIIYKNETASL